MVAITCWVIRTAETDVRVGTRAGRGGDPAKVSNTSLEGWENCHTSNLEVGDGLQDLSTQHKKA